jgi:hypothetical protein
MTQEFAPSDAAIDEAVDQMDFERAATAAHGVDKSEIPRHRFCSGWGTVLLARMLHAAGGEFNGLGRRSGSLSRFHDALRTACRTTPEGLRRRQRASPGYPTVGGGTGLSWALT